MGADCDRGHGVRIPDRTVRSDAEGGWFQLGHDHVPRAEHEVANVTGMSTILVGTLLFVLATIRFLRTAAMIDAEEQRAVPGSRVDVLLGGLLSVMGTALLVYLSQLLTAA